MFPQLAGLAGTWTFPKMVRRDGSGGSDIGAILGVIAGIVIACVLCCMLFCWAKQSHRNAYLAQRSRGRNGGQVRPRMPARSSLAPAGTRLAQGSLRVPKNQRPARIPVRPQHQHVDEEMGYGEEYDIPVAPPQAFYPGAPRTAPPTYHTRSQDRSRSQRGGPHMRHEADGMPDPSEYYGH